MPNIQKCSTTGASEVIAPNPRIDGQVETEAEVEQGADEPGGELADDEAEEERQRAMVYFSCI